MARVVEIVESPGTNFDLPLDIRGTAFQERGVAGIASSPARFHYQLRNNRLCYRLSEGRSRRRGRVRQEHAGGLPSRAIASCDRMAACRDIAGGWTARLHCSIGRRGRRSVAIAYDNAKSEPELPARLTWLGGLRFLANTAQQLLPDRLQLVTTLNPWRAIDSGGTRLTEVERSPRGGIVEHSSAVVVDERFGRRAFG